MKQEETNGSKNNNANNNQKQKQPRPTTKRAIKATTMRMATMIRRKRVQGAVITKVGKCGKRKTFHFSFLQIWYLTNFAAMRRKIYFPYSPQNDL